MHVLYRLKKVEHRFSNGEWIFSDAKDAVTKYKEPLWASANFNGREWYTKHEVKNIEVSKEFSEIWFVGNTEKNSLQQVVDSIQTQRANELK